MKKKRKHWRKWLLIIVLFIAFAPALAILSMRWINPATSAYMLRDQWSMPLTRGQGNSIHHRWMDIDSMARCMPLAVVAAEDQTFPRHHGFAWQALRKAASARLSGDEDAGGGSTISQQVAKNLFLWPSRSLIRKGIEAYLTVWIELLWPKRRILEVYLNIAQFDRHVYGAQSAALHFWHKPASRLTGQQCALLAAVLPAPRVYDAGHPSVYLWQRMAWIRTQMYQLGGNNYLRFIINN